MSPRRFLAIAALSILGAVPISVQGCAGRLESPAGSLRVGPAAAGERTPAEVAGAWSAPAPSPTPTPRTGTAPLVPQPQGGRVVIPSVAVLLPLSGDYAAFGEPALRGVRLGLGLDSGKPPIRALVHDTRGEAAEAERAYRQFASDPNVVAVLGPMLAWEVEAVKPIAAAASLPTVSFSQREVPPGGPILRFSMTRGDQAAVLAEYVVTQRGLTRFAILHPDDSYGNELASAFRAEVTRRGGSVVASESYDRTKVDFQPEVGRLRARLGIPEKVTPEYEAPIDAVFIPDSAEKVAIVAPFLPYLDIRGVQLLGANGWNQPEALAKGMPYVDGGVFVDGFYAYSFLPETRAFVDAYRDVHGSDPGILEAFGYDAARLVTDLFLAGAGDRQALLRSLRMPRAVRGATGVARFSPDGRVDRSLFVLRFTDGMVREMERDSLAPVTPAGETRPPPGGVAAPASPWPTSPWPTPRDGVRWIRPDYDSRTAPGTPR